MRAPTSQQRRVVVPIIDQDGNYVGVHHALPEELLTVSAYRDERGTIWTPPTAWAYYAVCKARDAARAASADTHPTGGDSTQIEAPASLSGAVPQADAQEGVSGND